MSGSICKKNQSIQSNISKKNVYILGKDSPFRKPVEEFIQNIYQEFYGAKIQVTMPQLAVCYDKGNIVAAMGIRPALNHTLYLEQYLNEPVENCISKHVGDTTHRSEIVEVGNLAVSQKGSGHIYLSLFMQTLIQLNYSWAVISATKHLKNIFYAMGVTPIELGVCDPKNLKDTENDWGTYYESEPSVLADNLSKYINKMPFSEITIINSATIQRI